MSDKVNNREIIAQMNIEYIESFTNYHTVQVHKIPNFNVDAYNDNKYELAVDEIMKDYKNVDDLDLTLQFLIGD